MYYTIERSCGHEEKIFSFWSSRDHDYWVDRYSKQPCERCLERSRNEAAAKARAAAQAAGLPELTGSTRQIRWAEQIRGELLPELEKTLAATRQAWESSGDESRETSIMLLSLDSLRDKFRNTADSSWWIDHREGIRYRDLERLRDERIRELLELEKIPTVRIEAEQEAILQKEGGDKAVLIEIRRAMETVAATTSEIDDEANGCLKAAGFYWDAPSKRWLAYTHIMYGDPIDRGADAACSLLNEGYPVRIYDEEIRRKALAADYEPVHWNCISYKADVNLLEIRWSPRDRHEYDAAMRISGAQYDKPGVVVHPQRYREVLDFAETRGYWITDDAREAMERYTDPTYVIVAEEPPDWRPEKKKRQKSMEIPEDLYDD